MTALAFVLALVAISLAITTAVCLVMVYDAKRAPFGCDRCCGCDPACDHGSDREHL